MKKVTFLKDTILKANQRRISKGTVANVEFRNVADDGRKVDFMVVTIAEGTELSPGDVLESTLTFKSRNYTNFFKAPSMASLEKWSDDGIAKTVTGKRTEPDGYGDDNSPSWLLALGMI